MRTLANIIWHIPLLGFVTAFGTFLVGGILTITIIAAPIGLGLIQLSQFLLTPFSMKMVSRNTLNKKQNSLWKAYGIIVSIFFFLSD